MFCWVRSERPAESLGKGETFRRRLRLIPFPGSLRAVLVDSTVPWEFAAPTGAEVFRFAAWDGGGNKAGWLLPAPGFLEELTDVPTPPTSARETYAVAQNLAAPPTEVQSAAQFLRQIDPTLPGGGESHPRALRGNFPRSAGHRLRRAYRRGHENRFGSTSRRAAPPGRRLDGRSAEFREAPVRIEGMAGREPPCAHHQLGHGLGSTRISAAGDKTLPRVELA